MAKGDNAELRADLADNFDRTAWLLREALCCAPLSGREARVLNFIIRRTYGYAFLDPELGKSDAITAREVAKGTGLSQRTCQDVLADLARLHVISRQPTGHNSVNEYGINPDIKEWGDRTSEWREFRPLLKDARDSNVFQHSRLKGTGNSVPLDTKGTGNSVPLDTKGTGNSVPLGHKNPTGSGANAVSSESLRNRVRRIERTEPEQVVENSVESGGDCSGSGSGLKDFARETAKRLGVPKEGGQLATWSENHGLSVETLQQALEITLASQDEVQKPVAYLQAVANRLHQNKQQADALNAERKQDRSRQAVGYAWAMFNDPVIGQNWRQALSIVRESFGIRTVEEILPLLPDEAREQWSETREGA